MIVQYGMLVFFPVEVWRQKPWGGLIGSVLRNPQIQAPVSLPLDPFSAVVFIRTV